MLQNKDFWFFFLTEQKFSVQDNGTSEKLWWKRACCYCLRQGGYALTGISFFLSLFIWLSACLFVSKIKQIVITTHIILPFVPIISEQQILFDLKKNITLWWMKNVTIFVFCFSTCVFFLCHISLLQLGEIRRNKVCFIYLNVYLCIFNGFENESIF